MTGIATPSTSRQTFDERITNAIAQRPLLPDNNAYFRLVASVQGVLDTAPVQPPSDADVAAAVALCTSRQSSQHLRQVSPHTPPSTTPASPSTPSARNDTSNPLTEYLNAILMVEASHPIPKPVDNPTQSPKTLIKQDNLCFAFPAPKFFRIDTTIYGEYRRISTQLRRLFEGGKELKGFYEIPPPNEKSGNEGTINLRLLSFGYEPATVILNSAMCIVRQIKDPTDPAHAPYAPLLNTLRKVLGNFSLVAQASLPEQWNHRGVGFSDLNATLFRNADADFVKEKARLVKELPGVLEKYDINYFGRCQSDNDVAATIPGPDGKLANHRVVNLESKNKDSFNFQDISAVLSNPQGYFEHEDLRRSAAAGDIPVREAFKRTAKGEKCMNPSLRYHMEVFAQGCTYTIQQGHKFGLIALGTTALVIRVDWEESHGDVVYLTPIKLEQEASMIGEEACTATLAELVAILAVLNVEAGIRSNEEIMAAGERMARYYFPNFAKTPPTGHNPPQPPSTEHQGDASADSDSTDDKTLEPSDRASSSKEELTFNQFLDKVYANAPKGYVPILPEDDAADILKASFFAFQAGDIELAKQGLAWVQPYHVVAAPALPVESGSGRGGMVHPSTLLINNLPHSPSSQVFDVSPSSAPPAKRPRTSNESETSVLEGV